MSCGGETAPTSQARDAGDARAPRDSAATPLSDARARKDAAVVATLPLGSPCTADDQCLPDGGFGQPPACLGGPFPGGTAPSSRASAAAATVRRGAYARS